MGPIRGPGSNLSVSLRRRRRGRRRLCRQQLEEGVPLLEVPRPDVAGLCLPGGGGGRPPAGAVRVTLQVEPACWF